MVDDGQSGFSAVSRRLRQAGQDFQARQAEADAAVESDPDVLWFAKGQPITGIGGGKFKLTATTLFFERGTLTTSAQQVPTNQLFDIDMRQSLTQKTRGVGDVVVHVQRPGNVEQVVMQDVPKPRDAVGIINRVSHEAKLNAARLSNTHHYSSSVSGVPPAQQAPVPSVDPIEQLNKLGQLRDAGVLTEEEFALKKAEILRRL